MIEFPFFLFSLKLGFFLSLFPLDSQLYVSFNGIISSTWVCWTWNDHNQLCATHLVGKCILPYPERPPRIIVIFRKYTPQNITVALEASLLGHLFIFQTIFQPWALSSEIPASWKGVYLFYNLPPQFLKANCNARIVPAVVFGTELPTSFIFIRFTKAMNSVLAERWMPPCKFIEKYWRTVWSDSI